MTKKGSFVSTIYLIFMVLLIGTVRYLVNDLVGYINYERELDGFYYREVTLETVNAYEDEKDPYGDWVNINIRGMTYEEAMNTCAHETGHEIFAEMCDKDIQKCFDIAEELENEE